MSRSTTATSSLTLAHNALRLAGRCSAVRAVGNTVLHEGKELFERAEPVFAACVDFFDVSLELARSGVRFWA